MSNTSLQVVGVHRRRSAAAPHWRFAWLFAAPHRLAFAAAAAMFAASALWWAAALLARSLGAELPWALPSAIAHGLVMGFGVTPLFFTGFLFTAGPKWLGQPAVTARALVPPVLAQLCGWVVFLLAVHGRDPEFGAVLGGLGLAAVAWGWSSVAWHFAGLLRASPAEDRVHAGVIAAAAVLGAVALWTAALGIAAGRFALVQGVTLAALWGFVGIVFATVSHRMIPFFSAAASPVLDAWRPRWLLWALVGTFAFEAAGVVGELAWWPLAPGWRAFQAGVELPAAVGLLMLAVRWGLVQSLRIRLLAMLHLGFVWLGIALLLAGVSHALMAATENTLSLGLAPLHAYTMGFLGSTLIAMVTRVTCGHGGRTLSADDFIWRLFWLLQLVVLMRVAAGVLAAAGAEGATPLLATAAIGWAGVCVAWAVRYGHWYGTPRADGRPG